MAPTRLRIQPVYSEQHSDPNWTIGSMQLLKHQVETLEAFRDPNVDVIFNTAMTGDGKSLAALLPTFLDDKHVVAMYPTNELIRDQCSALSGYRQDLARRLPSYDTMYSAKITELMRIHDILERLEEVRKLIRNNEILLTNPDLVHLVMSLQYGWSHKRKELAFELGAHFQYFLFDEFHVFDVPQVISVTNMLGYLHTLYQGKSKDRKKFLFLSATPSKLFNMLLARGGLRSRTITGSYRSSEVAGYRRILQRCDLELHEVNQDQPTELWIEEHLDDIRDFFQQHPGSKGAILVNSVATARRLVALLQDRLEKPYGITIGENTGLTNPKERQDSFSKTILVGTSTVDIGIDFRINYLVFEAFNSGTFIQRFGRLGRHAEFGIYRAYALVPRFVLERFALHVQDQAEVERFHFNTLVDEVFPTEATFDRYTRRWGVVQAAQVLAELQQLRGKDAANDENTAFTEALTNHFEQLYGTGKPASQAMKGARNLYWGLKQSRPEILAELASFRGQSPLSCGVWDTDGHLLTYDLFFLLTNTEYEVMEKHEFLKEVRRQKLDERDFQDKLLYLKILNYPPQRRTLRLYLNCDLAQLNNELHKLLVSSGFEVLEPQATWLGEVNRSLARRELVCILSDRTAQELKQRLRLGPLFQIHQVEDSMGSRYYIAFGQEALLLESELHFWKTVGDHAMML